MQWYELIYWLCTYTDLVTVCRNQHNDVILMLGVCRLTPVSQNDLSMKQYRDN